MAHMVNYDKMWAKKASKGYKTIGKIFKGALGLGAFLFSSTPTSSTTKTKKSTTRKLTTKTYSASNKRTTNSKKSTQSCNLIIQSSDISCRLYPGSVDLKRLDPMFAEVARYVVTNQEGSTSRLQRAFEIGYNRAGKISDQLEAAGILGPNKGPRGRDVLIQDMESLDNILHSLNTLIS